ncbi:MAG: vWA domain-containing protein, partial [Puniceicoccales bacterium]
MNLQNSLFFGAVTLISSFSSLSAGGVKDPVRVDASLDRPIVYANQPERVVVQIELQPERIPSGAERAPVNLGLVLDRSGSMRGSKMRQAIEAAQLAVSQLGPRDIISVVIYDNEIDTIAPAGRAGEEYRETIRRELSGVTARGNTAIYGGLTQAAAEMRKFAKEGYVNRLILLSDGLANQGPSSPADFQRLARAFASEDFIVSTIGLGLDFNEDIMTSLAAAGQGNTYFVESPRDLPRIFERELGDVLSVAATDIEITVRSRSGIKVLRGIGREAEIEEGAVARVRLPQVYGGLDKLALLELEVPAGEEGERRELVDIEVTYRPAGGGEVLRQELVVPVTFSAAREEIAEAVRDEVVANVAQNRIAESKAKAIAYADAGDRQR